MRYKGVLLDLDNTLYEYEPCNRAGMSAAWGVISSAFGITTSEVEKQYYEARERVKKYCVPGALHSRFLYLQHTVEALCAATDISLIRQSHHAFWDAYFNTMRLREGALDFLNFLRKEDVLLGIVSDFEAAMQHNKIAHLGIERYIHFVVTSGEVGAEKPHPRIFHEALKKVRLLPHEVVMIGDDEERDVKGATAAGIDALLFTSFSDLLLKLKNTI